MPFIKDGGRVVIHYHRGQTCGPNLLRGLIDDIGWRDLHHTRFQRRLFDHEQDVEQIRPGPNAA